MHCARRLLFRKGNNARETTITKTTQHKVHLPSQNLYTYTCTSASSIFVGFRRFSSVSSVSSVFVDVVGFAGFRRFSHLVADEVDRVIGVAILEQEVGVDRPGDHPGLEAAQPLEPRVSRGDGPHGHGVEEVHVLGGRLLPGARDASNDKQNHHVRVK